MLATAPVVAAVVTRAIVVIAIVMIVGQRRRKKIKCFVKVLWFHAVGKARKHIPVVNSGTDKTIHRKEYLHARVQCNAHLSLVQNICITKTLI